jgi:phosphatidylinositol glycan class V
MASVQPTQRPAPLFAKLLRLDNPIRSLTVAFWLWKVLLYIVVTTCPGLGYDTSTSLLSYTDSTVAGQSESLSGPLKFARWDSIYFLDIAEKGYIFEQESAFGYPKLLGIFVSGWKSPLWIFR